MILAYARSFCTRHSPGFSGALRWILFLYLTVVLCPVRFYAPDSNTGDNTWYFALNYAAAHHLRFGQDVVWTWGPLGYLIFPFDIGSNLTQALIFQFLLWLLLAVILASLVLEKAFPLVNLLAFTFFTALHSIAAYQDVYPSNLVLLLSLLLLVRFALRGGQWKYLLFLILIGLLPFLQFVGAVEGAAALAGYLIYAFATRQPRAMSHLALALFVPLLVWAFCIVWLFGSWRAAWSFFRASRELAAGYNLAMSYPGLPLLRHLALAAFFLVLLAMAVLFLHARRIACFYLMVFLGPVLVELRHALVRQDIWHVTQFVCFAALAFGFIALSLPLTLPIQKITLAVFTLLFLYPWWNATTARHQRLTISILTGHRAASLVNRVLHFPSLRRDLRQTASRSFADSGIEPELLPIIAHQSVASLSVQYSSLLDADLDLRLLPVIQPYSTYTPYLDNLNAKWLEEKGPQFLLFDGVAIDHRDPWLERPATWYVIYRWYNTRALGSRNLLLERRVQPRFDHLQAFFAQSVPLLQPVAIPDSNGPVFFTLRCSLNRDGVFRNLLYRFPQASVITDFSGGQQSSPRRVILPLLQSPALANRLPVSLSQFAAFFREERPRESPPQLPASLLAFGGPAAPHYAPLCRLEFLRPEPNPHVSTGLPLTVAASGL